MMDGSVGGSPDGGATKPAPKPPQIKGTRLYTVSISGADIALFQQRGVSVTEDVRLDFVVDRQMARVPAGSFQMGDPFHEGTSTKSPFIRCMWTRFLWTSMK